MPNAPTSESAETTVTDGRGNFFRLDPAAFISNVKRARSLLPPGCSLFQVVKGDGYGLGVERAVRLGIEADVDGFCVGIPEEAEAVSAMTDTKPVILFTSCLPSEIGMFAPPNLIFTVNSLEALQAAQVCADVTFLLELDCGFGRFGLNEAALGTAISRGLNRNCIGAYTHFGSRSFDQLDQGLERFDAMIEKLRDSLGDDIITMAAASHAMIWRPMMNHSAVDPGSLLYGLMPKDIAPGFDPVVQHVASRILQINQIERGQRLSIGYDSEIEISAGGRTGVFGLGWRDGLPAEALGSVLVNGVLAPAIGRTLLHTIVDLSKVPGDIAIGDEVVLVGRQGGACIELEEAARLLRISPTKFHFHVLNAISRPLG